jgi:hypothetical protein
VFLLPFLSIKSSTYSVDPPFIRYKANYGLFHVVQGLERRCGGRKQDEFQHVNELKALLSKVGTLCISCCFTTANNNNNDKKRLQGPLHTHEKKKKNGVTQLKKKKKKLTALSKSVEGDMKVKNDLMHKKGCLRTIHMLYVGMPLFLLGVDAFR